jgi:hypothetical protein
MSVFLSMFRFSTPMSDRERIMLSPIDKWKKYSRFPFKLVLHSILLTCVVVQVHA